MKTLDDKALQEMSKEAIIEAYKELLNECIFFTATIVEKNLIIKKYNIERIQARQLLHGQGEIGHHRSPETGRHMLDFLNLADVIVTIDAIGCQRKIMKKILPEGGHFMIPIKDNQIVLLESVKPEKNRLILTGKWNVLPSFRL